MFVAARFSPFSCGGKYALIRTPRKKNECLLGLGRVVAVDAKIDTTALSKPCAISHVSKNSLADPVW